MDEKGGLRWGVRVGRPSGRKYWYIQVCEAGQRYLRHVGSREAAERWQKEHIEPRLIPSSKRFYGDVIKNHLNPFFGDMPLAEITRRNVKEAVAFCTERVQASQKKRGERSIPNYLRTGKG